MKQLINKVQLIGNLVSNPSYRVLESGKPVARFSLATSEVYYEANGRKVTDTQWHNMVAFDGPAMLAERFLAKGSRIAVIGRLHHRKVNGKSGPTYYSSEVVINELMMLGSRKPVVLP